MTAAGTAIATAGRAAPTLLDAIATEAVRRGLREFTSQGLANTAWAFATAGHAAPKLLDAIADGGGAAAARLHAAGPRQHGVGLRQGWPRSAGTARRDRGGGGAAAARLQRRRTSPTRRGPSPRPATLRPAARRDRRGGGRRGCATSTRRTSPTRRGRSPSPTTSRLRSLIATTSCSCARRSTAFSLRA